MAQLKTIPIILAVALLSCKSNPKPEKKEYFEGQVDLQVNTYDSNDEDLTMIRSMFGTSVKTYVKDNKISREYYNDKYILRKDIQILDSGKIYDYYLNSSTGSVSDLRDSTSIKVTSMHEINGKQILNKVCKAVEINSVAYLNDNAPLESTIIYYFDTSIRLNPDSYKGLHYQHMDVLFKKYPYLTLGYSFGFARKKFRVEMIATKVTPVKLNDSYFAIPSDKTFIEEQF